MHQISVTCFGVGDGFPSAERFHSSYLYQFGKTTILLDCGECVTRSFKATGLSYDLIDRIFISHLHCDHIGGFFMFMQGLWLEQRQKELTVHLPADGIEPIRQMLNAACIFEELFGFRMNYEPLKARQPVKLDGVRVTPFATKHLDDLRRAFRKKHPQAFAAYCFLLETDRLRIGHSGDLGRPGDLEPLLQEPLDLLVCELAHFTPEDLFGYLSGRQIRRVVFVHLNRRYWDNLRKVRALAAKMLPDMQLTFARDQQVITLR
jgi:ribonuclease Z